MDIAFPLHFTLDDGTQVTVNSAGVHQYEFVLTGGEEVHRFTYDDREVFDENREAAMDFASLNALRRFWLLTRNEE